MLLGNTTHSIRSLSNLFRSANAPEQGVQQFLSSSKREVEFSKQMGRKTFWSLKNSGNSKIGFFHHYLGSRRLGNFRTLYTTPEITSFYINYSRL